MKAWLFIINFAIESSSLVLIALHFVVSRLGQTYKLRCIKNFIKFSFNKNVKFSDVCKKLKKLDFQPIKLA